MFDTPFHTNPFISLIEQDGSRKKSLWKKNPDSIPLNQTRLKPRL